MYGWDAYMAERTDAWMNRWSHEAWEVGDVGEGRC